MKKIEHVLEPLLLRFMYLLAYAIVILTLFLVGQYVLSLLGITYGNGETNVRNISIFVGTSVASLVFFQYTKKQKQ